MTAAVLAVTHPEGVFHAVDLMSEHIAYGRRLVERADVANLTLHEMNFAGAASLELPRFQYIVAHGVYSWIDLQAREDLRQFIDRHLAPDGLVYLSYNAMPGWAADLPFQHLISALAQVAPGDSIAKFAAAEAALRRFSAVGARALKASPMFTHIVSKQRRRLPARYFAHEYLAPAWRPALRHPSAGGTGDDRPAAGGLGNTCRQFQLVCLADGATRCASRNRK